MVIHFTVAICTYNGENRLPNVLDQLQAQVDTQDIQWEILVLDNNSTDGTKAVVHHYQTQWSANCQLRYCFEPEQGLAIARQRAVEEARGNLIGFLDDDNIPDSDWVAQAYAFGQAHPQAGAYGSRIRGQFEVTPPPGFERIAPFLALTDRGSKPLHYIPAKKVLPPGAGLVVRRQVWLDTVPKRCFLQGRVSGPKLPGEDLEALLHIQQAKWEIWYNPTMQISHQIPHWRFERDYLIGLCRGIGLSRFHTRMLSIRTWQRPLIFPMYVINDFRKLIKHCFRYRQTLQSDLIVACELELLISSLLSPFYLWKEYFKYYWSKRKPVVPAPVSRQDVPC